MSRSFYRVYGRARQKDAGVDGTPSQCNFNGLRALAREVEWKGCRDVVDSHAIAMFCPVCKAEYRQGFRRCADCDVELVYELPATALVAPEPPAAPGDPDEDPFCAFWSGDDPRIHAELCELLDKEGIPHKTVRREDHLFRISRYAAFQIGIPFSQFEKAEAVVKEAYGSDAEPGDAELTPYEKQRVGSPRTIAPWLPASRGFAWSGREKASGTSQAGPDAGRPHGGDFPEQSREGWDPKDWYPEDASVEIWEGEQAEMGELLRASLGENRIHARVAEARGKLRLFVLPEDETRAREIVREVIEGAAPS